MQEPVCLLPWPANYIKDVIDRLGKAIDYRDEGAVEYPYAMEHRMRRAPENWQKVMRAKIEGVPELGLPELPANEVSPPARREILSKVTAGDWPAVAEALRVALDPENYSCDFSLWREKLGASVAFAVMLAQIPDRRREVGRKRTPLHDEIREHLTGCRTVVELVGRINTARAERGEKGVTVSALYKLGKRRPEIGALLPDRRSSGGKSGTNPGQ